MNHPLNPTHHTCPKCGYVWEHGKHGGHSCSDRLLSKVAFLESAITQACEDFKDVPWGWDGDCGSGKILETLEDAIQ